MDKKTWLIEVEVAVCLLAGAFIALTLMVGHSLWKSLLVNEGRSYQGAGRQTGRAGFRRSFHGPEVVEDSEFKSNAGEIEVRHYPSPHLKPFLDTDAAEQFSVSDPWRTPARIPAPASA